MQTAMTSPPDAAARTHAARRVRAHVDLTVRHALAANSTAMASGVCCDLGLEQLVHDTCPRRKLLRRIPLDEDAVPLGVGEDRDVVALGLGAERR